MRERRLVRRDGTVSILVSVSMTRSSWSRTVSTTFTGPALHVERRSWTIDPAGRS